MFSKLNAPSFEVINEKEESFTLMYNSERPGLAPFVAGLVEGLAQKMDRAVEICIVSDESDEKGSVLFEIKD